MVFCHSRNVVLIKFLVNDLKLDVTETGYRGRNPFLAAVVDGKREHLEFLESVEPELKFGVDIDGETALSLAAYHRQLDIVEFLVNNLGVEITEKAYQNAKDFSNDEVVEFFESRCIFDPVLNCVQNGVTMTFTTTTTKKPWWMGWG